MKRNIISLLLVAAVMLGACAFASAQLRMPSSGIKVPEKITSVDTKLAFSYQPHAAKLNAAQMKQAIIASSLPLWSFTTVAAQDGNTYSGVMVGRSPYFRGKIPTNIPTMVIPVVLQFLDPSGAVVFVFDPTAPDPCAGGNTTTSLILNSPILNPSPYTMNGVNVGNAQYVDAFQRANFWQQVQGANYHVNLTSLPQPAVVVDVPFGLWGVGSGTCSTLGGIDINAWDSFVQTTLLGVVGATPNQLPLFFTHNVAFTIGGGCCALGYHNALGLQTYSVSEVETSGFFPPSFGDTVVMSHEVAEWMDDPLTNNPTPPWGNIGQVSGCQNNLEVGDPLTPTNFPSVFMNGFTYHLQELVFYSWFYGGPSTGTGGKYSNNGTFMGDAILCPPGGTN